MNTVRIGSEITHAKILGATKACIGLIPKSVRASICSVCFIEPISAARLEPDLPARISAEHNGANSTTTASAKAWGRYVIADGPATFTNASRK